MFKSISLPAAMYLALPLAAAGCAGVKAQHQAPPAAAAEQPGFVEAVLPAPQKKSNPLMRPPAETAPPSAQAGALPKYRAAQSMPAVMSQDEADIDRVSDRINRITTMRAEFTQIDSQGLNQGRFFLSRPGKVRFEYDNPDAPLVVADGRRVVVHDRKMDTYSRARIDETPLRLLLQPDIDLRTDAKITKIQRQDGILMVSAEETEGYGQGHITLIFAEPTLELLRWIVTDPMGAQTTVTLRNVQTDLQLDPGLFEAPKEGISFGNEL